VYDADVAGKMASNRSLDLFLAEEMDLFVARLPEGLDPYDCLIRKDGKQVFQKCIDEAVDLLSFRIETVGRKYNLNNIDEKTKAIDEILDTVAAIPRDNRLHLVKQKQYINQLSGTVHIAEEKLNDRLKIKLREMSGGFKSVTLNLQQQDIRAGEQIIEIMLTRNEFIPIIRESVGLEDYPTDLSRKIAGKIFENYDTDGKVTVESLLNFIADDPEMSALASRIAEEASQKNIPDYDKYLREWLSFIEKRRQRVREGPALKQQLKEAQLKGDQKAVDLILSKLQAAVNSR
ncbi:MAG: hypothetical protein AB1599_03265, partial [Planctomycetota bacterium]